MTSRAPCTPKEMLLALTQTANALDYSGHMALISSHVKVFGVPGFDVIGYDDWARQCLHEFRHKLLKQVNYGSIQVITSRPNHVLFKTVETIEGTDGTVNQHGLEVLMSKEPDGIWRVTQERILSPEEREFDARDEPGKEL